MAKSKQKPSSRAVTRRRKSARRLSKRRESPIDRLRTDGASSHATSTGACNGSRSSGSSMRRPGLAGPPSEDLAEYCRRHASASTGCSAAA